MRRMIAMSCAGVLLAAMTSGCFISRKKEIVREPRTTVERHTMTETVPGDTEIRTRTTVEHEHDY